MHQPAKSKLIKLFSKSIFLYSIICLKSPTIAATLAIEDFLKYRIRTHPAYQAEINQSEQIRSRIEAAEQNFSIDMNVKPYFSREIGSSVFRNVDNTLFRQDGNIYQSRITSTLEIESNTASRIYLQNDQP